MAERSPNVVVFMTDQQVGTTVIGDHPLKAKTPHLDSVAERGITFTRSYTVSPHCCPSRASFFTGLYPSEHGVWNNVNIANALSRGPHPQTPFWSQALADAGYCLGFSGKWHVSNTEGPADHGWQEGTITGQGRTDREATPRQQWRTARERELTKLATADHSDGERQPGEIIRPGYTPYRHYLTNPDPFADAEVVDSAIDFVHDQRGSGQPWFLYAGTLGPHDPYQPPQEYLDLYDPDEIELPANFTDPMADKPALYRRIRDRFDQLTEAEHRETLRHYLAFCSYEDALFGRLHNAVTEAGELENTIFVFLSDHGDYAGDHGLWCKGLPPFDPAYRIPTVVAGEPLPDAVRGTTADTPISIIDFGPTLLDLCRVRATHPMSGRSFAPVLNGGELPPREELIFQSNGNETYGNQRVVMTDRWKLVVNLFDSDELYDLVADPSELHNLLHRADPPRSLGVPPLNDVPEALRPVLYDLYQRLWRFTIDHDDDLTCDYIMTALGTYGPADCARAAAGA